MSDKTITVVETEFTVDTRLRCLWMVMVNYTLGILNAILAGINLNRGAYLAAASEIIFTIIFGVFAALDIKNASYMSHRTYVRNETITPEN